MVEVMYEGTERYVMTKGGIGWFSYHFDMKAEVTDASSTGFTLVRDTDLGIPGFDPIPDPSPDVYNGTGLQFTTVTRDGHSILTPFSGLIAGVTETGTNFTTTVTNLNIDAADFFRVSETDRNRDNVKLLKQVFSGDDFFDLGSRGDKVKGYNGNDEMLGRGGGDKLWGGRGNDTLKGGGGRDLLQGDQGDDMLVGGRGADTFKFKGRNIGDDAIEDWRDGTDLIAIKHRSVDDFSDLTLTQNGNDAVISYRAGSITLADTSISDLDGSDFLF
ncbi:MULTISPECIES: calcium-binding protein [Rhodobacterales]|jgi:Ca2+-binding RTX toxin-like protein|uniref:calcium-binding protein n=1 Tax=Rhodobacterales TaxID=204455 RepID=UPI00237F0A08|nr:hypothetical protein [Phaeobacter gallaeciensis]MDE4141022.1 hypothetical protein [Phaeobacter gallaeciensis]MDE4149467.1 hypothetical protein [Phaeobacter gallaeciensis]MDE4153339.1 hypothetical protein [Phaeobacter gallaeciensis]MDE4228728.1 hypothetical protein [Phaeobacter gallaeciensis]MDE4262353.1 hypothetical protein [Phaeobacter gallaeciensis]